MDRGLTMEAMASLGDRIAGPRDVGNLWLLDAQNSIQCDAGEAHPCFFAALNVRLEKH